MAQHDRGLGRRIGGIGQGPSHGHLRLHQVEVGRRDDFDVGALQFGSAHDGATNGDAVALFDHGIVGGDEGQGLVERPGARSSPLAIARAQLDMAAGALDRQRPEEEDVEEGEEDHVRREH